MTSESEIFAAAALMIKRHGADAVKEAAMRADVFGAGNNAVGQQHWIRIMRAVQTLQRLRSPAEAIN